MPATDGPTYGRAAMIGVLSALLLTICASVYLFASRYGFAEPPIDVELADPAADSKRLARLTILLTVLLVSALLILLFVVGCYLVIRVGRAVRTPVSGPPTEYPDAWQQYRLTDEEIAAATSEPTAGGNQGPDESGPGSEPESPPQKE